MPDSVFPQAYDVTPVKPSAPNPAEQEWAENFASGALRVERELRNELGEMHDEGDKLIEANAYWVQPLLANSIAHALCTARAERMQNGTNIWAVVNQHHQSTYFCADASLSERDVLDMTMDKTDPHSPFRTAKLIGPCLTLLRG